jgi:uroporphyrinogen-III synthase
MRHGGNQRAGSLAGLRVLVGRARHQAGVLSTGLRKLGAEVIEIPFIEIRKPPSYQPLDATLKRLEEYDWLIMTSVNGVDALWRRAKKLRLGKKPFRHLQIAAIGPATSKAIEKHGLRVSVVPKQYVAESVVESLRNQIRGKRVLLARARIARDVIPRELRALGAQVDVVDAYQTAVPKSSRSRLRSRLKDPKARPDVITFTSSSMVKNFVALLGENLLMENLVGKNLNAAPSRRPRTPASSILEGIRLVSIGPITSSTLRELNLRVDIEAKEYTIPGLIQAVAEAFLSPAKPSSRADRKI